MARELSLMHRIYDSATLVISAANANSSTEGFLRLCEPAMLAYQLRYRCPTGDLGTVVLGWNDSESEDPIHRRAWTLQEHLLAPRLAIYGTKGLRFSCRRGSFIDGSQTPWPVNIAERTTEGNRVSSGRLRNDKDWNQKGGWYMLVRIPPETTFSPHRPPCCHFSPCE
ncbi:uncharacterized protein A1O9_09459 [Exophiala aquamarina CBS 119918]|uniref:Heterokaryon incompatibility domain-containing protein n=1 Tax=Exophiala aquamarina CBS 119918 TaxID=1182545 RepID=A0A072P4X4_9EURO|nr:uncharacterized protein A1O9_09459 [Exophiala aquamarina CBS 119918]KEF54293.1 hypothetical protein A1O9_09459 [Exophiala aquamarina CBS 119918]